MHDPISGDLIDKVRTGSTGPRTPKGKAKSSRNSFKHGCRSAKTVLPYEDPDAFEATVQGWLTAYNPDTQPAITLVENLARAHWVLKRNKKRLEEVEWELPANASNWTDEHHKQYSTTNRYKTTAERSFLRYFQRSRSTLPTACTATTTPANSLSP
ncbi:MAG: hypothetical protein ACR2JB_11905, partial [Bryobacteraceae bacterium]